MTDYLALIRQLLEALEEERRIRILGQSPECGIVHWESIRDLRRRAYENTDVAITAARAALKAPPKQEPVALVTYHRDDTGQKAAEAYAAMVAQLSKENIRKLANEVAHGAKATLGRESIALTREDWSDIKLIPLATPQPQPAIPQGWQGLTVEELSDIYNSSEWSFDADWDYERAIEAALHEKNAALAASPTPAAAPAVDVEGLELPPKPRQDGPDVGVYTEETLDAYARAALRMHLTGGK